MQDLPVNIKDIIFINGLSNIINKPTHFDTRTGNTSLLDPILITDSIPVIDSDTIPIDRQYSDHNGTYVTIKCGFSNLRTYKRTIWDYKHGDYELMKQKIIDAKWDDFITDASNIHVACTNFTNVFLNIASTCIPTRDVIIRCDDKVWFNSILRREIRIRDRFRKKFVHTKTALAEQKYKNQRNKVNNLKKQAKKAFFSSINDSLDDLKSNNSKQYWKTVNMLMKNERSSNEVPPLKDPNEIHNVIYDSFEKSEILNKYFCSIATLENVHRDLPDFNDRCFNFITEINVSEQDVLDILSTLDTNKAVGPDIISNKMLFAVRNEISKPLTLLFTKSLIEKIFPDQWKIAHVIPLFKNGDKSLPSNYRPVALLSCVGKILEKIVFKNIFNHLHENNLLYKFQSGFIPGYSTTHQLVELYNKILVALNDKELTSITFADISRAFDTVWIQALILKLEKYGIKGDILEWLKSYLYNRSQRVILKNTLSDIGKINAGVPQGSVLGPLLFLVFINDIADDMTGFGRLFADDTSIGHTASSEPILKELIIRDLNHLKNWSKRWMVKFNQKKTDIMIFNTRNVNLNLSFDFDGVLLEPVQTHKHLGIIFSSDCKWTHHVDKLIERTSKQLNVLRKLKFKLKREYLEKIYLTFIRPILEYGSEVWDNCGQLNADRLEKIQIEAGRIVSGLTAFASLDSIYRETGWEKLSVRREVKKLTLFHKIVNLQSPDYLSELIPPSVNEVSHYNLRNSQNITIPLIHLSIYQQSYFPSTIKLWNSIDLNVRQIPSFCCFKKTIQSVYFKNTRPPLYYYCGQRLLSVLHARLRNNCSSLKFDLFHANLIDNPTCICGYRNETVEHYLLYCINFTAQRTVMLNNLNELNMNFPITANVLLYGDESLTLDENVIIFFEVQKFIKDSKRFTI